MINRLINILNRNLPLENREATWNWCLAYNNSIDITESTLENMADNNLCFGFFGGLYIGNDEASHKARAIFSIQKLAVELGVDNDLESIEKELGFKINLPDFIGGRKVLQTERGIISDRHCHYLWVMKQIIDRFPDRKTRIIEVGAGLGLLGYFLDRAGYKDYTTIDLAYANLCQSYFLYKNLPDRDLILSGEKENPFDLKYKDSLKLLHSTDFRDIDRWDIMINMDSLPEMNIEEAIKYISSSVPLLLSINRENYNFHVTDLAQKYRKQLYRKSFILRDDSQYFEELYQKL